MQKGIVVIVVNFVALMHSSSVSLILTSQCVQEKTGQIQSHFSQLALHFTLDELLQYHIMSQETFRVRMQRASELVGREVADTVVVFDMQGLTMTLSVMAVQFLQRMIFIDQNYYPETLHKLFVINAPVSAPVYPCLCLICEGRASSVQQEE